MKTKIKELIEKYNFEIRTLEINKLTCEKLGFKTEYAQISYQIIELRSIVDDLQMIIS
jgi:hypothetical protein